jgi:hypothetical protein
MVDFGIESLVNLHEAIERWWGGGIRDWSLLKIKSSADPVRYFVLPGRRYRLFIFKFAWLFPRKRCLCSDYLQSTIDSKHHFCRLGGGLCKCLSFLTVNLPINSRSSVMDFWRKQGGLLTRDVWIFSTCSYNFLLLVCLKFSTPEPPVLGESPVFGPPLNNCFKACFGDWNKNL